MCERQESGSQESQHLLQLKCLITLRSSTRTFNATEKRQPQKLHREVDSGQVDGLQFFHAGPQPLVIHMHCKSLLGQKSVQPEYLCRHLRCNQLLGLIITLGSNIRLFLSSVVEVFIFIRTTIITIVEIVTCYLLGGFFIHQMFSIRHFKLRCFRLI